MVAEIRGCVPKISHSYSRTLVNRAWKTVRESNLWSFNVFESAWISPPVINTGTVTVTQGSATIQFDATAIAAINTAQIAQPYSLITQRQIRPGVTAGIAGIYNLIQYDSIGGGATLDRIYADPSGTGTSYTMYQLYYTPPMTDFLTWFSVRNMQMFLDLGLNMTRTDVDARDPQRSWYQFPSEVIPFGTDQRGAGTNTPSATLGFPLFELWGQPVTPFTYQCYGIRRGVDLVQPTDTLPTQVGEDLVVAKAREYAYEWAESNKDILPRGQSPDYRFLMGKAQDVYRRLLTQYRRQDKELIDNYKGLYGAVWSTRFFGYYNSLYGIAGPYGQP